MSKSLYAQYTEEREKAIIIERPHGFAVYKIEPDHVYLQDIFIVREQRKSGLAFELFNEVIQIAKELGYTKLLGSVDRRMDGAKDMEDTMARLKFEYLCTDERDENFIYLIKEI